MKKRMLAIFVLCCMVLSACGKADDTPSSSSSPSSSESTSSESSYKGIPDKDDTVSLPFSLGLDGDGNYLTSEQGNYTIDIRIAYPKTEDWRTYTFSEGDDFDRKMPDGDLSDITMEGIIAKLEADKKEIPYSYSLTDFHGYTLGAAEITIYNATTESKRIRHLPSEEKTDNCLDYKTGSGTAEGFSYNYVYRKYETYNGRVLTDCYSYFEVKDGITVLYSLSEMENVENFDPVKNAEEFAKLIAYEN